MCKQLTCPDVLAVAVVLGLDEVRQHVLVGPAVRAVSCPLIVVVARAAQVLHVVEVRRAAQSFPCRPDAHLQVEVAMTLML